MSKVLVVGNVLKDVYLRLDERFTKLEKDENNVSWLDLSFDGSTNKFFERVSIFGGAAVTLEVLNNFDIDVSINGSDTIRRAVDYRYILCVGDDITYFTPSRRATTRFAEPNEKVDWIFVDKSAEINETATTAIEKYLQKTNTKLAVYAPKKINEIEKRLIEKADLIFAENDLMGLLPRGEVCMLGDNYMKFCGAQIAYKSKKEDFTTHLTIKSIAAASILGAILKDESADDSLLIAKANIENSTLSQTLHFDKLKRMIKTEKEKQQNLKYLAKSYDEKDNNLYGFIPVVLAENKQAKYSDIQECFNTGSRFARLKINPKTDIQIILECIVNCHSAMLVPILSFDGDRHEKNCEFVKTIKAQDTKNIDWESVVVKA